MHFLKVHNYLLYSSNKRMVRFARIKGVHTKSSFNKVPEEASTWEELKKSTSSGADDNLEPDNFEDVGRKKSLPKKVEGTWSEFEPEIKEAKKKKKKLSDFEQETERPKKKKTKNLLSDNLHLVQNSYPQASNEDTAKKTKNRSEGKEAMSGVFDVSLMSDEERAKKLQELRKQLKEQGKDEKDIFGLNELEKWDAENVDSKRKNWKKRFSDFEPHDEPPKNKKTKFQLDEPQTAGSKILGEDVVKKAGSEASVPPKKKTRKEKELEGLDFKRRKPDNAETLLVIDGKEVKLEKFDGYLVSEERAERLRELRRKLQEEGQDEKDIFGIMKLERRKAEKELKSWKKRMCFHCRKGGHNLSDCPELSNKPEQGSGICFKCGSTEHKLSQCRSKSTTLEFATCFICNEKGHLSRECTNNPRGLYPDGGGCKICGDVTHYERDCPKKRKNKKEVVSAKRIVFDDVEALDYDEEIASPKKPSKIDPGKRPNKIIKFD